MNERIKTLMEQADYAAPEIAARAQKLVELVVKDFYTICDQAWADNEEHKKKENLSPAEQLVYSGAQAQCQKMKENIKEFFGVEE